MTAIEWADKTWNPVVGCREVAEGCRNCYAARTAERLARIESARGLYEGLTHRVDGVPKWTGVARMIPARLSDPFSWRKPRRIFLASMSDVLHIGVKRSFLMAIFAVIAANPQHTFLLLTKRPGRLRRFMIARAPNDESAEELQRGSRVIGDDATEIDGACRDAAVDLGVDPHKLGAVPLASFWPPRNLWVGTSISSSEDLGAVRALQRTPVANNQRFLSAEPLLAPLVGLDLRGISWVIAGDESGPGRRRCKLDWIRSLKNQCVAEGVYFFFKQFHNGNGYKVSTPCLDGRPWTELPKEVAQ